MELKKNPKHDTEKKKLLFIQCGLIIALLLSYFVIEAKFYEKTYGSLGELSNALDDEEEIPLTQPEKPKLPPPPPPPPDVITVVEDNVELDDELIMDNTETDEEEVVVVEEEETEEVFDFALVEDQATYPGCEKLKTKLEKYNCFQKNINKFIVKNLKYPEIASEMGIQGRVFISFVIEKSGKISNVSILRGVDKNLDAAAIRVVKKLPNMIPARQRNKPVKVSFRLPVTFRLN